MPTETELAYAAGIIDGEGSIAIAPGGKRTRPMIEVSNTEVGLLLWMRDHFGGSIYGPRKNGNAANARPIYKWQLYRFGNVAAFLAPIIPFLVLKKDQARIVLEFCGTHIPSRKPMPPEIEAKRAELATALAKTQRRGVRLTA